MVNLVGRRIGGVMAGRVKSRGVEEIHASQYTMSALHFYGHFYLSTLSLMGININKSMRYLLFTHAGKTCNAVSGMCQSVYGTIHQSKQSL